MDVLTLLTFVWPQVQAVFPRNPPKLLIVGEPGAVLTGRALAYARTWANQREVSVPGIHSLQEDSPAEIGLALSLFLRELRPIT